MEEHCDSSLSGSEQGYVQSSYMWGAITSGCSNWSMFWDYLHLGKSAPQFGAKVILMYVFQSNSRTIGPCSTFVQ